MALLAPADALSRILAAAFPLRDIEQVPLAEADGRTLAHNLPALRTQPPFPASAMDGYAVRAVDLAPGQALAVVDRSTAGHPATRTVRQGEAIRIFTGAAVPEGADTILIQENTRAASDISVTPAQTERPGRHIRKAGVDFAQGDVLLREGLRLAPRHLGLAASMGHAMLPVRRRPRVAIISTGDELVLPGSLPGPAQIVSSNASALAGLVREAGGEAIDLGIAPDDPQATEDAIRRAAAQADIVVTSGGASVGDHDLVQAALTRSGFRIDFWKVAIRPGKPLMFGSATDRLAVGLPGNPVSGFVCALLFLQPLIRRMLGQSGDISPSREPARLGRDLPPNDLREEYMRAALTRGPGGGWIATPLPDQDSSLQRVLAEADGLVIRPADAPAAKAGDACLIIRF